jgi:stalled ribosome alternative rescue factor ArfA
MEVDQAGQALVKKTLTRKRVEKRRKLKSRIVFPKYSDRNTKVKKR